MRKTQQRGAVFVVTLLIMLTIVAIVASVATTARMAYKAESNRMLQARARIACMSGVQRAIEVLVDASQSGSTVNLSSSTVQNGSGNLPGASTQLDDWYLLGTTGNDRFLLKDSQFRLQIIDASSRANINTISTTQLQDLPLSQQQIDALSDWRTPGEVGTPDGAKDSYYNNLTNPYDAALRPLSTLNEILDIRYFTVQDLYDPPTTQSTAVTLPNFPDGRTPTLAEILTVDSVSPQFNQAGRNKTAFSSILTTTRGQNGTTIPSAALSNLFGGAAAAIANGRPTTWAALIRLDPNMTTTALRTALNNYYMGASATPAGKINLNTATATVLETIPGLAPDIAQSIVNQQQTGFTQSGDILSVSGLGTARSVQNLLDYFAVKSSVFIIRVIGIVGNTQVPMEAVVSVGTNSAQILRMEEQPFNDMTGRWGWPATTNNDITLEEGS